MTTREIIDLIRDALEEHDHAIKVQSFREAGVLTDDRGIVVTLPSGTTYEITIARND